MISIIFLENLVLVLNKKYLRFYKLFNGLKILSTIVKYVNDNIHFENGIGKEIINEL